MFAYGPIEFGSMLYHVFSVCRKIWRQKFYKQEDVEDWSSDEELDNEEEHDLMNVTFTYSGKLPYVHVYLGGPVTDSTWRQDIAAPLLERLRLSYFDPTFSDNHYIAKMRRMFIRNRSLVLMYVLDKDPRTFGRFVEVAALITHLQHPLLIVVLQPVEMRREEFNTTNEEYKQFRQLQAKVSKLANLYDVPVFDNIPEAIDFCRVLFRDCKYVIKIVTEDSDVE